MARGLLYPHFSLHNDLADFHLPTHKEVALQLQVSNYPGVHDICEQNYQFRILLPSSVSLSTVVLNSRD